MTSLVGTRFPESSPLSTRTTQHQEAVKTVCQKMEPWWVERPHLYFCAAKRQQPKLKHCSTASLLTLPQTPKVPQHNLKTQNGHNLEEVNIRTISPAHKAQEAGPALRRAWLCRDGPKVRLQTPLLLLLLFLLCIPSSLLLRGVCLLNNRTHMK